MSVSDLPVPADDRDTMQDAAAAGQQQQPGSNNNKDIGSNKDEGRSKSKAGQGRKRKDTNTEFLPISEQLSEHVRRIRVAVGEK